MRKKKLNLNYLEFWFRLLLGFWVLIIIDTTTIPVWKMLGSILLYTAWMFPPYIKGLKEDSHNATKKVR